MTTLVTTDVPTPIGPLRVTVRGDAVVGCAFADHHQRLDRWLARRFPRVRARAGTSPAAAALGAWIDGDLDALDDVAVDLGGTAFQRDVWAALRAIPTGRTRGYAELASAAGHPGAARAAGTANGANPVSVIVPCHRVVPVAGGVGGYAGGSERKRWLLAHEARHAHHGRPRDALAAVSP